MSVCLSVCLSVVSTSSFVPMRFSHHTYHYLHTHTQEYVEKYCSKAGWQRERIANFGDCLEAPKVGMEDFANDGWTWSAQKTIAEAREKAAAEGGSVGKLMELQDMRHMEQIRQRVGAIVTDPATAEALKPHFRLNCKRPCYHDEYLYTFNRPNVTLVDCPKVQGWGTLGG